MRVVVADDSGYVGRKLAVALAQRGAEVYCIVPSLHVSTTPERHMTFVSWENVKSWHFPGSETAYHIALAPCAPQPPELVYEFASRLRENGVQKLIHMARWTSSGMEPHQVPLLEAARVPITELLTSAIIGDGSPAFEFIRAVVERFPVIPSAGWTLAPLQPIAISDAVEFLLQAQAWGSGTRVLAGSSIETYSTMMAQYARARALPRVMLPVRIPDWLWSALVTSLAPVRASDIAALACSSGTAAPPGSHPMCVGKTRCDEAIQRALQRVELPRVRQRPEPEVRRTSHLILRRHGFLLGQWQTRVEAPAAVTFSILEGIGGQNGWLFADELWRLRGALDRLSGGPGMSRRRDPDRLRIGDTVDFWTVEQMDRGKVLRLRAEMKMPGEAWLQFECKDNGGESLLTQTIYYRPRGLSGEIYWAAMYPFHLLLFDGLHHAVASEARRRRNAKKQTPQLAAAAAEP